MKAERYVYASALAGVLAIGAALWHPLNEAKADRTSALDDWAADTFRQYANVLTPREADGQGDATVVKTGVAGTFPGSPIELNFRFVTEGEEIKELEIG